ncbi:MAG: heparinase II/III family protein [Verrucomicrobiota bacterium]
MGKRTTLYLVLSIHLISACSDISQDPGVTIERGQFSEDQRSEGEKYSSTEHVGSETILDSAIDHSVPEESEGYKIPSHPRIVLNLDTKLEWQAGFQDAYRRSTAETLLKRANRQLTEDLPRHPGEGKNVLNQSRLLMRRAYLFSFAYIYTGELAYKVRLWENLEAAGNFEDWGERKSFLATAEMMHGFSIAYDWLYSEWDEEQRLYLQNVLFDKGVKAGAKAYANELPGFAGWNSENNWNLVCNSSIAMASLALWGHKDPVLEANLKGALERLPRSIKSYQSDGGWKEGITYWNYGSKYLGRLLATLDYCFTGTTELVKVADGLKETGYFPIYLTSPTGYGFDFGDSEHRKYEPPILAFFARFFENREWQSFRRATSQPALDDLLFYWEGLESDVWKSMPLDRLFPDVGVATMRGSWDDPNSTFVGIKGGVNGDTHSHLDLGSFVFDAQGTRWVLDIPKERYSVPGYFKASPTGLRWRYYRSRAEGHNTLVIGRSATPDQNTLAKARFLEFFSGKTSAFAVMDLTEAYPSSQNIRRGIVLDDQRTVLVIKDEISLKKPESIVWSAHTKCSIEISVDQKSVTLKDGEKTMTVRVHKPNYGKWSVDRATPLIEQPQAKNSVNLGIKALRLRLQPRLKETIAVSFDSASNPLRESEWIHRKLEEWNGAE